MSWVKLDDRFFDNPKIASLSDSAKIAYLEGLTYCARVLTDGLIPTNKAKAFAGKTRVLQELVPGLWELRSTGYQVHDYLQYNLSRAEAEALKEERSKAGSRGAANRWQLAKQTDGKSDAPLPVSPSLPDPVDPETEKGAPRRTRRRPLSQVETELPRLQDDYPSLNVAEEFTSWNLYLKSKAKTYTDYVAAFETWLRNEVKYAKQRTQAPRGATGRTASGRASDEAREYAQRFE